MRKMLGVCDYFVISSGTSTTQVRAIADNIARRLREKDERVWRIEGEREGRWVLIDCGDVVAHVFLEQTRRFYDLESLWKLAPQARHKEGRPLSFLKSRRRAPARAKKSRAVKRVVSRKRKK
jgi:ribosome silencing factor RsfS/YbeB/iojap